MDRKTLIFTLNRLYDVLTPSERCVAFEYLEKNSDTQTLFDLYQELVKKFVKNN